MASSLRAGAGGTNPPPKSPFRQREVPEDAFVWRHGPIEPEVGHGLHGVVGRAGRRVRGRRPVPSTPVETIPVGTMPAATAQAATGARGMAL
jgi:hypothetical protein